MAIRLRNRDEALGNPLDSMRPEQRFMVAFEAICLLQCQLAEAKLEIEKYQLTAERKVNEASRQYDDNIRTAKSMIERGYLQRDVAAVIGISTTTVSKYARRERPRLPSISA